MLITSVISIRKDSTVIRDLDFGKVQSIVVVVDGMKFVQWYSWVREGVMRMIVQVLFDAVEAVIRNFIWNWSILCITRCCISQVRTRPNHDMHILASDSSM